MSDAYEFSTTGIQSFAALREMPGAVKRNAVRAVNKSAASTRTEAARTIEAEIAYRSGYLKPSQGRLAVRRNATEADMSASIFARMRPTSLASFVTSGSLGRKGGVTVQVKRGQSIVLSRAFLVKLRAGTEMDDDRFNLGLAIRLKPGESLRNKRLQIKQLKDGRTLLYGPSVAQAFRQLIEGPNAFLVQHAEEVAASEFDRLMEVFK